jgi:hypothetical protein
MNSRLTRYRAMYGGGLSHDNRSGIVRVDLCSSESSIKYHVVEWRGWANLLNIMLLSYRDWSCSLTISCATLYYDTCICNLDWQGEAGSKYLHPDLTRRRSWSRAVYKAIAPAIAGWQRALHSPDLHAEDCVFHAPGFGLVRQTAKGHHTLRSHQSVHDVTSMTSHACEERTDEEILYW